MVIDRQIFRKYAKRGTVKSKRPCRTCGYILHGLPVDGNCPECGSAVKHQSVDDRSVSDLEFAIRLPVAIGTWCALGGFCLLFLTYLMKTDSMAPLLAVLGIAALAAAGVAFFFIPDHPATTQAGFGRKEFSGFLRWASPIGALLAIAIPLLWDDLVTSTRSLVAWQLVAIMLLLPVMAQLNRVAYWMQDRVVATYYWSLCWVVVVWWVVMVILDAYGDVPVFRVLYVDCRGIFLAIAVGLTAILAVGAVNMLLAHGPRAKG